MSPKQVLEINHFDPKSRQSVLPYEPILSSKDLGWDKLLLQHYSHGPLELAEHTIADHGLALALKNAYAATKLNGKFIPIRHTVGAVTILPKGSCYGASWNGDVEYINLLIKPEKLQTFAPESIEADSIELTIRPRIESDPLITGILVNLRQEIAGDRGKDNLLIDHLQNALLAHLLQFYCSKAYKFRDFNGLPPYKLKLALTYINENLSQTIKLVDIAKLLNISPGYFSRLFRESTGVSPHQYILKRRIKMAQQIIKNSQADLSLKEVAKRSGFKSTSHFCHRFTQMTGINPSKYRDSL